MPALMFMFLAAFAADAPAAQGPGSPGWLAGYWVSDRSVCEGSDDGTWFEADGTYSDARARGRWTFDGRQLTMTVTAYPDAPSAPAGQVRRVAVNVAGADEMRWTEGGGRVNTVYRCPAEAMESVGP